jgi:hypothetical protein
MFRVWIVPCGHLHAGEPERLVAAQSMKLEISEQNGPMVQPQFEAEGLETLWRVAGVSPHSETEEVEVSCPQVISTAIEAPAQEEKSLHALACFLLLLLFYLDPQPIEQCHPHLGRSSPSVCSPTCQLSPERPSQTHLEVNFTNFLGVSQPNWVDHQDQSAHHLPVQPQLLSPLLFMLCNSLI